MQQTEKYKFNLIETSDPFSPEALNKNMETLETELARLDGADAALAAGQLVYKIGSYTGKGTSGAYNINRLEFDFKPLLLISSRNLGSEGGFPWFRGQRYGFTIGSQIAMLTWEENAVSWYANASAAHQLNTNGYVYDYIAIGVPV